MQVVSLSRALVSRGVSSKMTPRQTFRGWAGPLIRSGITICNEAVEKKERFASSIAPESPSKNEQFPPSFGTSLNPGLQSTRPNECHGLYQS